MLPDNSLAVLNTPIAQGLNDAVQRLAVFGQLILNHYGCSCIDIANQELIQFQFFQLFAQDFCRYAGHQAL